MSMTVSATTSSSSTALAGGVQSKGGATEGGAFGSTLNQVMSGTSDGQTSSSLMTLNSLPEGMTGLIQDSTVDSLATLVEALVDQLKLTDAQLEQNPALLAELQQWVAQAQAWLTQTPLSSEAQVETLPPLAQQSQTITLVVRDLLQQAASQLNGTASTMQAVDAEEGMRLLQQLGQLLTGPQAGNSAAQQQPTLGKANAFQQALASSEQRVTAFTANTMSQTQVNHEGSQNGSLFVNASEVDVPELPHITTAGQLAMRAEGMQAEKAAPVMRAQHFAEDMMGFMVKQLRFKQFNGVSEAKISLYPEHLGQVDIRLTMQNGQLVARFVTEHVMAKDALEQQMSMLRGALTAQGIQVEKLEVTQQSASALTSSMFQEQRQTNAQREQSSSKQSKQRDERVDGIDGAGANDAEVAKAKMHLNAGSFFTASV
ncbi:flagellar hook-length control protein FliK [Paenibacillus sp. 481]|uniref:flagellar hook-length control protein FliK n=1 Tax=Paenibacillus sp. 481 TaxID=2835869 RepID=UPI001E6420E2|nr:flagellar hook-length control protein FliK [Paenibacillus sp. 481]UHA73934.1 flagellar hook-length control protein FliK [Paenibacillus sp. 481]